jgi:hypothetical protein
MVKSNGTTGTMELKRVLFGSAQMEGCGKVHVSYSIPNGTWPIRAEDVSVKINCCFYTCPEPSDFFAHKLEFGSPGDDWLQGGFPAFRLSQIRSDASDLCAMLQLSPPVSALQNVGFEGFTAASARADAVRTLVKSALEIAGDPPASRDIPTPSPGWGNRAFGHGRGWVRKRGKKKKRPT